MRLRSARLRRALHPGLRYQDVWHLTPWRRMRTGRWWGTSYHWQRAWIDRSGARVFAASVYLNGDGIEIRYTAAGPPLSGFKADNGNGCAWWRSDAFPWSGPPAPVDIHREAKKQRAWVDRWLLWCGRQRIRLVGSIRCPQKEAI